MAKSTPPRRPAKPTRSTGAAPKRSSFSKPKGKGY